MSACTPSDSVVLKFDLKTLDNIGDLAASKIDRDTRVCSFGREYTFYSTSNTTSRNVYSVSKKEGLGFYHVPQKSHLDIGVTSSVDCLKNSGLFVVGGKSINGKKFRAVVV